MTLTSVGWYFLKASNSTATAVGVVMALTDLRQLGQVFTLKTVGILTGAWTHLRSLSMLVTHVIRHPIHLCSAFTHVSRWRSQASGFIGFPRGVMTQPSAACRLACQ